MGRRKRRKKAGRDAPHDGGDGPVLSGVARLLTETPTHTLDLHGSTADQAERRLFDFVRTRAIDSPGRVVHVITGRGNRSGGPPVLPGLVRDLVASDLAEHVAESAGLPGGGGMALRLR